MTIKYLDLDGDPVVLDQTAQRVRAWVNYGEEWKTLHPAETLSARVLDKEKFNTLFPDVGMPEDVEE